MDTTIKLQNHSPAPDFTLADLGGQPHALKSFRGQIVILNFWSAECPWSLRADEALTEYMESWGKAVIWVSIAPNANESPEMLVRISTERGLPLVLRDPDRGITEKYGAEMTPHLFVLDAGGILRYQGAFDDITFRQREPSQFYLKDAVEALLAGNDPEPEITDAYGCTIVYYEETSTN